MDAKKALAMDNAPCTDTDIRKRLIRDQILNEDLEKVFDNSELESVAVGEARHMSTLRTALRVLIHHPSIPLNQT